MDLHKLVGENQSIKIVPSIEESLRSTGLNVDLDDGIEVWFSHLKKTWKTWKKSAPLEQSIETFFQSIPDPHRVALALIIKCDDFKDCKAKTLPFCIIEILQKWSQKTSVTPEESLKLPAFRIATKQRNQLFFSLIVETYQLYTIKHVILPIVNEMIAEGNHKQASQIIIAMKLFDDIPVEDLLFPLILQDKHNTIDDYLTECPHQAKPFLLFLDNLLDKSFSIREYVQEYLESHKVTDIKYEKLHYRPLGKLVGRLCNKFKIPIESCKNLSKNRTTGGLRYLIHQKYQEHNVSSSVWEDLVKDSLKQNADSAFEFIDMLSEYDKKEALKWAEYLNMPESKYPPGLKEAPIECITEEESWDDDANVSQQFYKSSLGPEQIVLVDTPEKFYDMMNSDLLQSKVVSIDCEWKPSFGATQSQVALVQIAMDEKVYLIDTLLLNKKEYASFWYTFNKSLLDNAEIIKLGFGLEQDLREMKVSVVGLNNIKVKGEGLLDLSLLWKSLLNSGLVLCGNSDISGNSLSSLVQSCFGLPLAKSEQCSNWELRPLRSTQIEYAALDAHILIEIYYFLQKLCLQQGIKFEEICNDIMLEGKQKSSKKSIKVADRIQASFLESVRMRSVNETKFLVDPKLSNLMSYLRYCGIDTTVNIPSLQWHEIVNLAISEDRLILVPKTKFSPSANFPQSSIFEVGVSTIKEQVQKIISNFKISVKESDLFSRCIYCNETHLRKLTFDEMQNLYKELNKQNHVVSKEPHYDNDHNNYDDFLSDSDCDDDLYLPAPKNYFKFNVTTSKGVPIQCDQIDKIISLRKPAILCDSCGKIFWDEEILFKTVGDVVHSLTKLSMR